MSMMADKSNNYLLMYMLHKSQNNPNTVSQMEK